MKLEPKSNIESLLEQMDLAKPPGSLDDKIRTICQSDVRSEYVTAETRPVANEAEPAILSSTKFGWGALLATAAASILIGFLIGQFAPDDQRLSVAAKSLDGTRNGLTPVKFSSDAFGLLHTHSVNQEYEDCSLCHEPSMETAELFQDWYYGDKAFFRAHENIETRNCQDCHVESKPATLPSPDFGHGFHNVQGQQCSDCHQASGDVKLPTEGLLKRS